MLDISFQFLYLFPIFYGAFLVFEDKAWDICVEKAPQSSCKHFCVANVTDVGQSRVLGHNSQVTHIYPLYMESFLQSFTIYRDHNKAVE